MFIMCARALRNPHLNTPDLLLRIILSASAHCTSAHLTIRPFDHPPIRPSYQSTTSAVGRTVRRAPAARSVARVGRAARSDVGGQGGARRVRAETGSVCEGRRRRRRRRRRGSAGEVQHVCRRVADLVSVRAARDAGAGDAVCAGACVFKIHTE